MHVELFTFPGSNAGLTIELLLAHAGVEYRERRLRPGLHVLSLRARGFGAPTVPAARIDGERVQGTRRIARVIADALPESGLLPPNADARELVLDAERDGERLQNAARRLVYVLAQDDPEIIRPLVDANYGFLPDVARGVATRGLIRAAAVGHHARKDRVDRDLARIAELLDRFDELVEDGVLGTRTPNVADFQIGPNLAMLSLATELGDVLRSRPCWRIAERVSPYYPLDVRASAPAAWAVRLSER